MICPHCKTQIVPAGFHEFQVERQVNAVRKAERAVGLRQKGVKWIDVALICGYAGEQQAQRAVRTYKRGGFSAQRA